MHGMVRPHVVEAVARLERREDLRCMSDASISLPLLVLSRPLADRGLSVHSLEVVSVHVVWADALSVCEDLLTPRAVKRRALPLVATEEPRRLFTAAGVKRRRSQRQDGRVRAAPKKRNTREVLSLAHRRGQWAARATSLFISMSLRSNSTPQTPLLTLVSKRSLPATRSSSFTSPLSYLINTSLC